MRKFLLLMTLAAAATVAAGITAQAQTYGPGMMGNDQNYGNHRGYGPGYGMMGGSGYGPDRWATALLMAAVDPERAIAANAVLERNRLKPRLRPLRAVQQLI